MSEAGEHHNPLSLQRRDELSLDVLPPVYKEYANLLLEQFLSFYEDLTDIPELENTLYNIYQDLEQRDVIIGLNREVRTGALFIDLSKPRQISLAAQTLPYEIPQAEEGDIDLVPSRTLLRTGLVVLAPDDPRYRIRAWGELDKQEVEQITDNFIPGVANSFPAVLEIKASKNMEENKKRLSVLLQSTIPSVLERNSKI